MGRAKEEQGRSKGGVGEEQARGERGAREDFERKQKEVQPREG